MKVLGVIALAGGALVAGSAAWAQNWVTAFDDPGFAQQIGRTLKSSEAQCEAQYPSGDGVRVCACLSAVTMMASITSPPQAFKQNAAIVQKQCRTVFNPAPE
jgi:hypothetical protein